MEERKVGIYEKYIKRALDVLLSGIAIMVLSPVFLLIMIVSAIVMKGNPFFTQLRPGKDEHLFWLVKFRTMTNKKDRDGKLLPDAERLTSYGKFLRSTSLDELPELLNILVGNMSIVGPRPQLVRDMVFMTPEQRKRHSVRQGLTGLAQVNGRNGVTWEEKLRYDLEYIEDGIMFLRDCKIILETVQKVFQRDGINEDGMATAENLGDYLLRSGKIDEEKYKKMQDEAYRLIRQR